MTGLEEEARQPLLEPLTDREVEILRHIAEGASDREIAGALYLSLNTIKWHNRQIYSKLGVDSRTKAVALASREGLLEPRPAAGGSTLTVRGHNLPTQMTTFVGREAEIEAVTRLLNSGRLLTLTGPAGVGKTRLATQVAAELLGAKSFPDGICFIDLAPINRPEAVGDAIVEALGVAGVGAGHAPTFLAKHLEDKKLLLLFDNFEHLVVAAPLVGDLLAAAPDLKCLATSREALGLYGEQEYQVPPLKLPDLSVPASPAMLKEHESVALFVQRAQAVKADFTLADAEAAAAAEICVRLDGLPLAIELAAARVKAFSPQALLGQMESRFTTLKGGPRGSTDRQRTLRGAIDWSYDLLDSAEAKLFARLAVFKGGRTIEAVEEVCCRDLSIDVLDGLVSLLNQNLLGQEDGPEGEPRFTMLETINEYARERLEKAGEGEASRRKHAQYFTSWAERVRPDTRAGPDQLRRLHQLEAEQENLRAALDWSLGGADPELGLRLVGALGHFWWRQGHYAEGKRWTTAALAAAGRMEVPVAVRAALLDTAGLVAHFSHERERGKGIHREAQALYERLGDKRNQGWVLIYLAAQSFGVQDEYEQAMDQGEEGLSLLRSVEDEPGVAQALHVLGELARLHGDYEEAVRIFQGGLSLARKLDDRIRQAFILDSLAYLALYDEDSETAADLSRESLKLALEVGYRPHIPACLAGMAAVQEAAGATRDAARLLGAADALFVAQGFGPRPSDTPDVERTKSIVRDQLGDAEFEAVWTEGREMSVEEAIAFALEGPAPDR